MWPTPRRRCRPSPAATTLQSLRCRRRTTCRRCLQTMTAHAPPLPPEEPDSPQQGSLQGASQRSLERRQARGQAAPTARRWTC